MPGKNKFQKEKAKLLASYLRKKRMLNPSAWIERDILVSDYGMSISKIIAFEEKYVPGMHI
jgi:hypothetical protein